MQPLKKYLLICSVTILCVFTHICFSQNTFINKKFKSDEYNLIHPDQVNAFYELNQHKLFWYNPGEQFHLLRIELKNILDSADNIGLKKNKYHLTELNKNIDTPFTDKDSLAAMQSDRIFTDAAIAYCKDIYQGLNISNWISYDEISNKYEDTDNNYLLSRLASLKTSKELVTYFYSLELADKEYIMLKTELQNQLKGEDVFKKLQLSTSLNLYRWIHHFHFDKYIIVNIGSATLRYYEYDSLLFRMKVVVGKPSTKTSRFAAYCNQVILYPYWNVPASIALNELLPKFKRNPNHVDELNMQLIDAKGKVIDPHKLNWKTYNKNYFPYRIRQSTGCDNSLGVIKFNLTSPYSIYLHDTNNKTVFKSATRYFSHGCIRLEEPVGLANKLLKNKIDKKFIESCLKDQIPVPINLDKPIPVFVVYMTAEIDSKNTLQYYKDVYSLLNKNQQ